MLLDFKNRVAFILIPKNASSSVRQTLMKHDPVQIFCNQDAHQGLHNYDQIRTLLWYWRRVAIIRNPVDRHVSWWRYMNRVFGTSEKLRTAQPTQLSYVTDDRGNLYCDTLLRYENLEEDWAEFAKPYGYPEELFHLNKTPEDAPWPKANFIHWAQGVYLEDYEAFGYPMIDEISP